MIKGAVQQEHITLVNIYAPNTGASEYVKQILMDRKGQARSIQSDGKQGPTTKIILSSKAII